MNNGQTHNGHLHEKSERALRLSLGIVIVFMVAELIGGILSNSLALIGDAGHMLVDGLALGLSTFAIGMSKRPATARKTFGFYRVEIMAALTNGVLLVLISFFILYEAYQRFIRPPEVKAPLMLAVAVIGLLANIAMIFLLRKGHESLNVRAAFWHVATDTLSSVGVIAAGIIISITGVSIADPVIAGIISILILWGAVRLIFESADILLEAVPRHIKMDDVIKAIREVPGIKDVHDIHIWTITSGIYALSSHLSIEDCSVNDSTAIMSVVNEKLGRDFGITHTTLQAECGNCPTGFVCGLVSPQSNGEVP